VKIAEIVETAGRELTFFESQDPSDDYDCDNVEMLVVLLANLCEYVVSENKSLRPCFPMDVSKASISRGEVRCA
jgi:hypothetical protein